MRVAVIGSGLSGLTAAGLLARAGHAVTVYEQHDQIGGVTATLERDGFKWDLGPMLVPDLSEGEPGRLVLERLGVSDQVKTLKSYRGYSFPDFAIWRPESFEGRDWRKDYLKGLFPEDARGLDAYHRFAERVFDLMELSRREGFASRLKLLWKLAPIYRMRNWSAERVLDHFFTNRKLKTVFSSILADYVTRPCDFPALGIPMINSEQLHDERFPLDCEGHEHRSSWSFILNGCIELVNAIAGAVERNGGQIRTGTPVHRVRVRGGRVVGVVLEGGAEEPFDAVVASGGSKELFLKLVGREHLPEKFLHDHVDRLAVTASVFMVHLGVDYDPSVHQRNAALCYYYLTYNVEESVRLCESGVYHEGRDGFLVYIPSVHSPAMAPAGHHAVTVYTIAPNVAAQGSWSEMKEKWADRLVELAEEYVPGLREHTKVRVILTPEDFRKRTYLDHHAFGGCPPRVDRSPPQHRTPIEGLWFVGAQSEAYGGVVGAMTGAEKTVRLMLKG